MKTMTGKVLESQRITTGPRASSKDDGFNGAFLIPVGYFTLRVICSNGDGWEHVSVSLAERLPTWDEMCAVKDLFWEPHECVVQYHPPRANYVNIHPHCLHLWRPTRATVPMPPTEMV